MAASFSCIEVVVSDMATSLAFYRRLGLDIPADADEQPHAEAALPGGLRLLFDTEDTIRSFDESWRPPAGGHGLALGFGVRLAGRRRRDLRGARRRRGARATLRRGTRSGGSATPSSLDPDGNHVDLFAALPG